MYSDRALKNFETYLRVTPSDMLGRPSPLGAYDAVGGARAHGFDSVLRVGDFEKGGRFDYRSLAKDSAGEEGAGPGNLADAGKGRDSASLAANATAHMRFLAKRLTPADWSDFQKWLCREEDDEDTAADDIPGRKPNGMPLNGLPSNAESAMDAALRITPEIGRVRNLETLPLMHSRRRAMTGDDYALVEKFTPGISRIVVEG